MQDIVIFISLMSLVTIIAVIIMFIRNFNLTNLALSAIGIISMMLMSIPVYQLSRGAVSGLPFNGPPTQGSYMLGTYVIEPSPATNGGIYYVGYPGIVTEQGEGKMTIHTDNLPEIHLFKVPYRKELAEKTKAKIKKGGAFIYHNDQLRKLLVRELAEKDDADSTQEPNTGM